MNTTPTPARQASRALARMIAVRVVGVVFILLVISLLTFGLMYLAPGDLVKNLLGNRPTSPEAVAAIREQYRLDDPFLVQYFTWLGNALQGDFGTSVRMQQPVTTVIGARVGLTVALCLLAFVIAAIVAIPLGIASASRTPSSSPFAASNHKVERPLGSHSACWRIRSMIGSPGLRRVSSLWVMTRGALVTGQPDALCSAAHRATVAPSIHSSHSGVPRLLSTSMPKLSRLAEKVADSAPGFMEPESGAFPARIRA